MLYICNIYNILYNIYFIYYKYINISQYNLVICFKIFNNILMMYFKIYIIFMMKSESSLSQH